MRAAHHFAEAEKYLQQAKTDLARELGEEPDLLPEDHMEIVGATLAFATMHAKLATVAMTAEQCDAFDTTLGEKDADE